MTGPRPHSYENIEGQFDQCLTDEKGLVFLCLVFTAQRGPQVPKTPFRPQSSLLSLPRDYALMQQQRWTFPPKVSPLFPSPHLQASYRDVKDLTLTPGQQVSQGRLRTRASLRPELPGIPGATYDLIFCWLEIWHRNPLCFVALLMTYVDMSDKKANHATTLVSVCIGLLEWHSILHSSVT